jgi:MYXO-CTERM domain-containing protein
MQVLQVPLPAPRMFNAMDSRNMQTTIAVAVTSYFVELRAPIGIDRALTPRVLVEVGGEIRDAIQRGSRNWLVDMNPATSSLSDAGLAVGATYKDPDPMGPTITVVAADATRATIKVQLASDPMADKAGGGTCSDGTAFMAPGPDTCEAPIVRAATDAGATTPADAGARPPDAAATRPPDAAMAAAAADAAQPPNPMADAAAAPPRGTSDASAMAPAAAPEAGAGNNPSEPEMQAAHHGCGCRLGGRSTGAPALLIAAGALFARRRRRR